MKFGQYSIEISHEKKIFFPDAALSKKDLIDYYIKISNHLLPHLNNRPITIQRFPDGNEKDGFFQKEVSEYFPDWIDRVKIKTRQGKTIAMPVIKKTASLIYLVNQGAIPFHRWLSRADQPEKPDLMIFDLDPSDSDLKRVVEGANKLRDILEGSLGFKVYVMSTGSRGLHVVVPLSRERNFDAVREFARKTGEYLATTNPDKFTLETRKENRGHRLFIDYMRNAFGQTAITPYSVRPLENAPVAMPLSWDEINDHFDPRAFTVKNIFKRLGKGNDPWEDITKHSHSLKTADKALEKLQGQK